MNNKELKAETEVQQIKNAELLPSAPLVANPMLNAVAVKLSKTQKEFIKEMQNGVICHCMQGLNASCFLARTGKNISWATIYKLENSGLIKRNYKFVVLTEKGSSHCI